MKKIDFRKIIGYYDSRYSTLDSSTAWYEWLTYCEICHQLNVPGQPNITRFLRYRSYLREIGLL